MVVLCTLTLVYLTTSKEEMETQEEKKNIATRLQPVAEEVILVVSVVFGMIIMVLVQVVEVLLTYLIAIKMALDMNVVS